MINNVISYRSFRLCSFLIRKLLYHSLIFNTDFSVIHLIYCTVQISGIIQPDQLWRNKTINLGCCFIDHRFLQLSICPVTATNQNTCKNNNDYVLSNINPHFSSSMSCTLFWIIFMVSSIVLLSSGMASSVCEIYFPKIS